MSIFEITQGDYGAAYVGSIEGVDMSSYSAKVYIWDVSDTIIINGVDCAVTFVTPDTRVSYIPAVGVWDAVAVATYRGVFLLSKAGTKEHLKPFAIQVLKKPPGT